MASYPVRALTLNCLLSDNTLIFLLLAFSDKGLMSPRSTSGTGPQPRRRVSRSGRQSINQYSIPLTKKRYYGEGRTLQLRYKYFYPLGEAFGFGELNG